MKAGLEVHQQLATGKLFCDCPSELSESIVATVSRTLRATGGENHLIDAAAAFQASRGFTYRYETTPSSCLVEIDEEPPHRLNPEAVDVALSLALLLDARPLDEIEVMRKIVVDGSNTAGFQRTALVAVDGHLSVGDKTYSIPSICLEEDAARRIGESAGVVTFRLDRLGIPLIEVATGPEIASGPEAREVAEEIGALLRSTGRVRRGIGTIREDLNVSTEGGRRIEIKGVQELRKIHRYVEGEEARQKALLEARERLREQGARVPDTDPVDVTSLLGNVTTGPVAKTVRTGGVVLGSSLLGFAGILKPGNDPPERLGRELADQARSAGLRGLLHSDELPGEGIDRATLDALRAALGPNGPRDAFVLVAAADPAHAREAMTRVRARAAAAIEGIPAETRDPLFDGRSRYSRPLPGRDRMYPETDVPPIVVQHERLARLRKMLPERPESVRARLERENGLSSDSARQLQRSGEVERFSDLVSRGRDPLVVARLLLQDLPSIEGSDGDPGLDQVGLEALDALLRALEQGRFAKEGVRPILVELAKGAASVEDALHRTGLSGLSAEELRKLAEGVVDRNARELLARGSDAFSPLMGDLMKEVRGRRDGREVAEALRDALSRWQARGGG